MFLFGNITGHRDHHVSPYFRPFQNSSNPKTKQTLQAQGTCRRSKYDESLILIVTSFAVVLMSGASVHINCEET